MQNKNCDGGCLDHRGEVKTVKINWPPGKISEFNYCDSAIEEDKLNGFVLQVD